MREAASLRFSSAETRTGAELTLTAAEPRCAIETAWIDDDSPAGTSFDWRGRSVAATRA
jgi:hypothetical protein